MASITLDPDFECYAITKVIDRDHFLFDYYEEPSQNLGDEATVYCFSYSEIIASLEPAQSYLFDHL
jgi:hypothetical protein